VLASKGGGGGLVVACYKGDELVNVELLDLYEGRAKGIKYAALSGDWEKDVQDLAMKIAKNDEHAKYFIDTLKRITSTYRFIPEDSELELTNDAFPAFLPRGCKAKQVANYYNDRLVWIDSALFNKMSYRDQLALAFHETIYYMERINRPDSDSRYTRTITAHIFSQVDAFVPPFSENYEYYCAGSDGTTKYTSFLAKRIEGSEDFNFEFSFIMLNGHYSFTQKIAHVYVNPGAIEKEQDDDEAVEPHQIYSTNILSKINPGESIIVTSTSNRLTLSWQGTDPGDSIRGASVSCFKHSPYINIFPFMYH
jgi:hypothetical protein